MTEKMDMDRRSFLTGAVGVGAIAAMGALAGCSSGGSASASADSGSAEAQTATSWRDKPAAITDIASTEDYDVVVVGAGNGGLVAACTALDEGAKVVVLEKSSVVAMAKEAIGSVNSAAQQALGLTVDIPELIQNITMWESGDINPRLYQTWAEKSGEMMDWMSAELAPQGIQFVPEYHAPDQPEAYYPPICNNSFGGTVDGVSYPYLPDGPAYGAYAHLQALADYFTGAGGTIEFKTPAAQLVVDDSGKVTGVIAQAEDESYIQYNAAKGVILCTGGYAANAEMLEDLAHESARYCSMTSGTNESGDGIRMAMWAGAALEPNGSCMIWNRALMNDDTAFGSPWRGAIFLPGSQPFLHVNMYGERFMNEDKPYPMSYSSGVQQPGHFSWSVWDASYWDDIVQFDTCGCSRLAPAPSGTAFNSDVYDCEQLTKEHLDSYWLEPNLESGALKKCDTLDALADAMGFDATAKKTFLASVDRYNQVVAQGVDEDFGKAAYRMSAVDQGPFYAAKMSGLILCTGNGIVTDTYSRALTDEGTVVEGLYVCGNDQGCFYPHNYPSQLTGMNMGRVCTFARIAAKHAMGITD